MTAHIETKKALEGVRVLDLSNVLAGPFCATVLGEFGADVVKVELPGKGDTMRTFGTMTATGATLNWLSEARNKRCITLDLRKPAGLEIAKRLVAQSDIVVENFTTGTLEGWGLGYEDMKTVNPEIILVRITAYGQTGPYNDRPGFARIAHGFAGLANLAGEPGGPPVIPGSTSLADYISGLYGALGALIAYVGRQRHGIGQYVDIGLYEGVFRMLDEMAAAYAKSGYVRERMGADTVNVVPHSHYRTRDDKWIALACTNDRMWQRLCKAMDRLDLLAADKYAHHGATPGRARPGERDRRRLCRQHGPRRAARALPAARSAGRADQHHRRHLPGSPVRGAAEPGRGLRPARGQGGRPQRAAEAFRDSRRTQVAGTGLGAAQRRDLSRPARHVGRRGRTVQAGRRHLRSDRLRRGRYPQASSLPSDASVSRQPRGASMTNGATSVSCERNHSRSWRRSDCRPSAVRASSWPMWIFMSVKR